MVALVGADWRCSAPPGSGIRRLGWWRPNRRPGSSRTSVSGR